MSDLKIALMIEGQNGLNWERWKSIVLLAENYGFSGIFRSDHFTNPALPDKDSLELWVSLTWLASHTKHIEFGPLVTPLSFRHPVFTAKMAAAVDDLSGGRLILGLGAGWQEREHKNYGFQLLPIRRRFDRFEEGIQIIRLLLNSEEHFSFSGEYYSLTDAILLPRPTRYTGPPIMIGGNGLKRTLPLVAKYASEWNAVFVTPESFKSLNETLDEMILKNGRNINDVKRSVMTGCIFGVTKEKLEEKVQASTGGKETAEQLRERGLIVGTGNDILEQLEFYRQAGVEQIMLQWMELDDLEGIRNLADSIFH